MTIDAASNYLNKLLTAQEKLMSGEKEESCQMLNVLMVDIFTEAYNDSGTNLSPKEWAIENRLHYVESPGQ